jgi:phosphomannomutase
MNKTIVLFDMDGTLTEPRQSFDSSLLEGALYHLTNSGIHIGIITGSDEDYLREQMGDFLTNSSCRYKLHLLPCNGTKYLKPPQFANQDFELIYEVSMEQHLGAKNYKELMQELIYSQVDMANSGVPLTGHFINCRGSMINWCPIGRNANISQREEFVRIDEEEDLRNRVLSELRSMLALKDLIKKVTIKLGGDTSFDIYPSGWDKTHGLRHFQNWDIWFVGDRCSEDGNDYEIYQACLGQSYVSSGPPNTEEIIRCIIEKLRGVK